MQNQLKPRRSYLDVIRILASFLVCFNHSEGFHIFLDQQADGSLVSWLMVLIPVITRVHLPLFIMITGALTLGRAESYRNMGKRLAVLLRFFWPHLWQSIQLNTQAVSLPRNLCMHLSAEISICPTGICMPI